MDWKFIKKILLVFLFGIAFAYIEAAVVAYLRTIYYPTGFHFPLVMHYDRNLTIEFFREFATLVILFSSSALLSRKFWEGFGYFVIIFGVWDIFYYVWLFLFINWPKSLFEWDILFLIPLPWWGPVITPVLISLLLIAVAYLLIIEVKFKITSFDWIIFCLSIIIILYTFMEDSIKIILSGGSNLNEARPTDFNWILFLIAYISMIITSIIVFYTRRNN